MLLNVRDVDFNSEWDLVVKNASRPIHKPSTLYNTSYYLNKTPTDKYDLEYDYDFTPSVGSAPCPSLSNYVQVDLLQSPMMVYRDGGNLPDYSLYTQWRAASVSLSFGSNYPYPGCAWYLNDGTTGYWYAPYGLISYTSIGSGDQIIKFNELWTFGNWRRHLLFSLIDGEYVPVGSMYNMSSGGNRASVHYSVDVLKANGDVRTYEGSSIEYSVNNSPYTTTMAFFEPFSTYGARGDMKGQVLVTKTPYV